MLSSTVLTIAIAGLLSLVTSSPMIEPVHVATDYSSWVSVDFQGTTIQYNPAAFIVNNTLATTLESHDTLPTDAVWPTDAVCGPSSFVGGDGPYPHIRDCSLLGVWVENQRKIWSVWPRTSEVHGVARSDSCEFGAGTESVYDTYVGSHDIAQLINDSIKKFEPP
ncbi:hypothetical protein V494_02148 [Pseudogymnoascus sp. VKM F-4513 (FW-928)]|nr:hypothetical protein V494_02148 [Pseudogymnoascus sp. VKM F-4513 (FW-928)]